MDAASIEARLRLGEDSRTEFKSVIRTSFRMESGDLARAVACLANSGGGHLFLGVEDDGSVTGTGDVQQTDRLMRQVIQVCLDRVRPSLACALEKASIRGNVILLVDVPAFAPERPYLVDGVCYVRDGASCRPATRAEQIRILQSESYHFDEQELDGAQRSDLDEESVSAFMVSSYGVPVVGAELEAYLRRLHCLSEAGRPTVSGLLFFGRDPQRILTDARISAVRVRGVEPTFDFLDKKEIGGPLPNQIDTALAFLARHLPSPATMVGTKRRDLGLPAVVLREVIVNALSHRDYRMAAQTRVFVYDDRLEVANPGGLLNRLSIDSIRLGITQRRNPVIASLLAQAERRENIGFGIRMMFRVLRELDLPSPEISAEADHFRVILRLQPPS